MNPARRDDLDSWTSRYMLGRALPARRGVDAEQALRRFKVERPDLVVVASVSPPRAAVEVAPPDPQREHTPLLVLTGAKRSAEILQCLSSARDFRHEALHLQELTLASAILRRAGGPVVRDRVARSSSVISVWTLRCTRSAGTARHPAHADEYRIFHALVESAGMWFDQPALRLRLGRGTRAPPNSLRSHICHLRKKLRLDGDGRGSIASVPAVGYIFRSAPPTARDRRPHLRAAAAGP